jgi:hypothetical protein
MVWDHIPKEEARQMAAVWAMEDARKREARTEPEPVADPPQGSTAPVYRERPPWQDAIGYVNDDTIEFKAQYRNGKWWSQGSDEPMRSTTHAHLKDDPNTILWDKRPKSNDSLQFDESPEPDIRPEFKEIPGDEFITHELLAALSKIFGEVHVARREGSDRLGGVDYRLWAVDADGTFPLGGSIYRHPKIKFRTSMNGKFDFGDGRQGSFIFDWDTRLGADQPLGEEGLLYTKEVYGERPIFSECPRCQNKSLLQRGPQDACHACSRNTIRAYRLAADLGVSHQSLEWKAKELGIRYRNYMTPIPSKDAETLRGALTPKDDPEVEGPPQQLLTDLQALLGPLVYTEEKATMEERRFWVGLDKEEKETVKVRIWDRLKASTYKVAVILRIPSPFLTRFEQTASLKLTWGPSVGFMGTVKYPSLGIKTPLNLAKCTRCGNKTRLPEYTMCACCFRSQSMP